MQYDTGLKLEREASASLDLLGQKRKNRTKHFTTKKSLSRSGIVFPCLFRRVPKQARQQKKAGKGLNARLVPTEDEKTGKIKIKERTVE